MSNDYARRAGWARALPVELDGPGTVVFAFGASSYAAEEEPWASLRTAFPRSVVVGCSTAGEILEESVEDETVSIVVVEFERTPLRVAEELLGGGDSFDVGARLGRSLAADDLRAVFVLCDGLDVNGTQLTEGMASVLSNVPTSGGLAGDGTRFQKTWVLAKGRPTSGVASAIGFYGNAVRVGHGSKGGWDKFGPERRITRAKDNVLHELDERPALDVYERYLGDLAAGLPATALLYPIAIRKDRRSDERLVRTVLKHSAEERSLTFAGDMPVGALAQLMRANLDRLVEAAHEAAVTAAQGVQASLCLAVSCVGRRLVLGSRTEDELSAVKESLPPGCELAGFYSYGEISPHEGSGGQLHNQTMTLTMFAEVLAKDDGV